MGHVVLLFQRFKLEKGLCKSDVLEMLRSWVRGCSNGTVSVDNGIGNADKSQLVSSNSSTYNSSVGVLHDDE